MFLSVNFSWTAVVRWCVGCPNTSQVSPGLKKGGLNVITNLSLVTPSPHFPHNYFFLLTSTKLHYVTFRTGELRKPEIALKRTYTPLSLSLANFILGGISMISALLLSFCLKFLLLTFPQLFPETQKRYIFCASICIVTEKVWRHSIRPTAWCVRPVQNENTESLVQKLLTISRWW